MHFRMRAADLIGFHTFDYARHFLSCCSRMLGLEHKTNRGSIIVEYYGRDVGIKIMPTGERLAAAWLADDFCGVGQHGVAAWVWCGMVDPPRIHMPCTHFRCSQA